MRPSPKSFLHEHRYFSRRSSFLNPIISKDHQNHWKTTDRWSNEQINEPTCSTVVFPMINKRFEGLTHHDLRLSKNWIESNRIEPIIESSVGRTWRQLNSFVDQILIKPSADAVATSLKNKWKYFVIEQLRKRRKDLPDLQVNIEHTKCHVDVQRERLIIFDFSNPKSKTKRKTSKQCRSISTYFGCFICWTCCELFIVKWNSDTIHFFLVCFQCE